MDTGNQAEIHGVTVTVDNKKINIFNYYCPQDKQIKLKNMTISENDAIIVGDFNSHSTSWGYQDNNKRGDEVEDWQIENNLLLLNEPDDPPTFFSRRHQPQIWHSQLAI